MVSAPDGLRGEGRLESLAAASRRTAALISYIAKPVFCPRVGAPLRARGRCADGMPRDFTQGETQ